MSETKHEKFVRLSKARVEKATHHIALIENLASSNYEYSKREARDLVDQLDKAVKVVAAVFGVQAEENPPVTTPVAEPEPAPEPVPETKNGAPLNEGDVRWALDMLTFGKIEDAQILLKRAILSEPR